MTTPGHQVGALADEAGQLLDAVAQRLEKMKAARADGVFHGGDEFHGGDGAAAPPPAAEAAPTEHTCVGWCPICRGAELLRGDRTEISDRLLDTAILVVGTLRSLMPEPSEATAPATPDQTSSAPQPGVERIDIR